jgi:nucleotide-binding universal stress UspA family protein
MFQPRVILHPTNLSASSAGAFRIATDLARQYQATLLILHVVESLGPENVTYGEAVSQLEPEAYRQRLDDDLHQHVPAPAGITTQYLIVPGDPVAEILRVAHEHACDLIVMGTHGRTGLSRLLVGSVAEPVIRQATCPVLVTKFPTSTTSQTG